MMNNNNNNNNNANNPPTAQIIDFDNYDPFGANDMLPGGLYGANDVNPFNIAGNNNNNVNINNNDNYTNRANNRNEVNNNPAFSPTSATTTAIPVAIGPTTFGAPPPPGGGGAADGSGQPEKAASIFSVGYYRIFFDIQGDQVLQRAWASLLPQKGHLERNICDNPDLYGPVWIAVSLIVSSAISHGIAQFIQNAPNCVAVDTDMRRTSFVASVAFLYAFLLPAALWAFLKYQDASSRQPLPSYMCLYGYSMAVFIPISILWVIRIPVISWPVMLIATTVSAYSLAMSLWPSLMGLQPTVRLSLVFLVLVLHLGLAVSLGAYAFEPSVIDAARIVVPNLPAGPTTTPTSTTTTTTRAAASA